MTRKTNQFNLRTIRYTQSEIEKINKNKKNIIFLISLKDIYGDHGIVGILIAKTIKKKSLFIDTLLLSCRVLGRNLETWVLKEFKKIANKSGFEDVYAEYIKTDRNIICSNYLSKHNFNLIKKNKEVKNLTNTKIKSKIYYSKLNNIKTIKANVYY